MTFASSLVLSATLLLQACGGRSDTAAPREGHADPGDEHTSSEEATRADDVRVEPGMLRDLRITTTEVEVRRGEQEVTLLGELAVDERAYAEVGAPVAARVTRLLANAGDAVQKGRPLAELSSPELGKARADFLSAKARLMLADTALERRRGLADERIVPLREVQEAEGEAAEARAALRSAEAAVRSFGVAPPVDDDDAGTSSTFVLRSPISGVVIERTAVLGQMLDPATPAFRVGNLATLWLTVHASERDAVRIERALPARLTFTALPGRDFEGTVALVGKHVERESRTVPIRVDVRNRDGVLRPGMSATAAVRIGGDDASILSVPVAAVQRVRNEWSVFLPRDQRTFEIRRIGRGRDLGTEVEVLSGLQAGETVVVDGAFLLKAHAEKGDAGHDDH